MQGIVGIGETDTNPWVARECIRARGTHCMGLGLQEMLLGADPMQPEAIWETLYRGSKMTGPARCLDLCAWGRSIWPSGTSRARRSGSPSAALLGGDPSRPVTPYASLLPTGRPSTHTATHWSRRRCGRRRWASGRRSWRSASTDPTATTACRRATTRWSRSSPSAASAVGPELVLMVDVAYAWPDAADGPGRPRAARAVSTCTSSRRRSTSTTWKATPSSTTSSPIPIAAGEWQNTHFEFLDLADRGKVDVLQPDVGRVGGLHRGTAGLSDRRRPRPPDRAALLEERHRHRRQRAPRRGVRSLPLHRVPARRARRVPAPPRAAGRRPPVVDGRLELPERPGLGIKLNRDALQKYRVDDRD